MASVGVAGAWRARSRHQIAAARLTNAAGPISSAAVPNAIGARMATRTTTRESITAEAAAIPATSAGAFSVSSRSRVASAAVTAVEDTIAPVAAIASVPRVAPNRFAAA